MKTLAIIRIKMVVSVVQSRGGRVGGGGGGFCLGQVETPVFSVVLAPSRDFLVLNGPNMAGLCDRKIEEDKTDLML